MNSKERVKMIVRLGEANIGILYLNTNITDGYDVNDVEERLNFFAENSDYSFELYKKSSNNVLGLKPNKAKKLATPEEV